MGGQQVAATGVSTVTELRKTDALILRTLARYPYYKGVIELGEEDYDVFLSLMFISILSDVMYVSIFLVARGMASWLFGG